MLKYILNDKRTLALLGADLLVFIGVAFLNWNPARMIGFYYLDVCLCIISFLFYNIALNDNSDYLSMISATGLFLVIMYLLFWVLTEINFQLNFGDYRDFPLKLYYPYFDVALFITFSGTAHILNMRKYLAFNKEISRPAFSLYLGIMFLMIPALWVIIFFLSTIHLPLKFSLILSLILIRNYTEYRRYRSFIEVERENNRTNK